MSTVLRIGLGLFLVAHGLVHLLYFVPSEDPKYPMTAEKSWLVTRAGLNLQAVRPLVAGLAVASAVGFIALALSYWGLVLPEAWFRGIAVVSVTMSMLLIAITWNNQFVFAVLINATIIVWAFRWGPR